MMVGVPTGSLIDMLVVSSSTEADKIGTMLMWAALSCSPEAKFLSPRVSAPATSYLTFAVLLVA